MFPVQLINAGRNSENKDSAEDRKHVVHHALCESEVKDPAIVLFTEIGTNGLAKNVNSRRGRGGWGQYALPYKFEMISRNDEAAVMVNIEKIEHAIKIDLTNFDQIREAVHTNYQHLPLEPVSRSSCALITLPCSEHSSSRTTMWARFWRIFSFAVHCEHCHPMLTIALHMPNNKKGDDGKCNGGRIVDPNKIDNLVLYLRYFLRVVEQVKKDENLQQLSVLIGVDAQIKKDVFSSGMPQEMLNDLNICNGCLGIDFFICSNDLSMDNVHRFEKPVGCENVTGHDPVYGELRVNLRADASGPEPGPSHPMPAEVQVQVQDEHVADPGTKPTPNKKHLVEVAQPGPSIQDVVQDENVAVSITKKAANKKGGCVCKEKENKPLCWHGSCSCRKNGGCTEKCPCKGGAICALKTNDVAEE